MTKKQKLAQKRFYKRVRAAYERTGGVDMYGDKLTYIQFRNKVRAQMKAKDLTVSQATKKVLNTEEFTSAAQRSRANLISSLRKDFKKDFEYLVRMNRKFRQKGGKFKSMKDNLEWNESYGAYVLGGRYLIDVTDSPKQVNIIDLEWENI